VCVHMHAWPSVCARVSVHARMRISTYFYFMRTRLHCSIYTYVYKIVHIYIYDFTTSVPAYITSLHMQMM
jgi:hypothetical protein